MNQYVDFLFLNSNGDLLKPWLEEGKECRKKEGGKMEKCRITNSRLLQASSKLLPTGVP